MASQHEGASALSLLALQLAHAAADMYCTIPTCVHMSCRMARLFSLPSNAHTDFLVSHPSRTFILKYPANTRSRVSPHRAPSLRACMRSPIPEASQGIQCYQVACRPSLVPAVVCKFVFVVHPTAPGSPAAQERTQPPPKARRRKKTNPPSLSLQRAVCKFLLPCQLHAELMPCNSEDGTPAVAGGSRGHCRPSSEPLTWKCARGRFRLHNRLYPILVGQERSDSHR